MSKKKKPSKAQHKKENVKQIQDGLKAIYGDEKVDFSKIDRKKADTTTWLLRIIFILAGIAAAAWGSFFVYQNYFAQKGETGFELDILHEKDITSGTETSLSIHYRNRSNAPLAALDIDLNIPDGFIITSTSEEMDDTDELIWQLGSLPARSDGIIDIEGIWVSDIPDTQVVQVLAEYKPSNFNADFQKIETLQINTIHSIIDTELTGPEELTPGDIGEYELMISNPSAFDSPPLRITIDAPDGFFLEDSDPEIEPGSALIFDIPALEKESETSISFSGSFSSDTEGFEYVTAITSFKHNDQVFEQTNSQMFTDVLASDLSVQLVINGSGNSASGALGEDSRITVAIENTGSSTVDDASLLLDFQVEEGKRMPILWSSADYDGGTLTSDGVRWNSSDIGSIAPGEKKLFNLRFPIKSTLAGDDADALTVIAHVERSSGTVRSKTIPIIISASTDFNAWLRYFDADGVVIGSGPLPPVSSEKTTYQLVFEIGNSIHPLQDIRVESTLAPAAAFEGGTSSDSGSIFYDADTRKIIWDMNDLAEHAGNIQATVFISITPDAQDIGNFVQLLSAPTLIATDAETSDFIQESESKLTTELVDDSFNTASGVVSE